MPKSLLANIPSKLVLPVKKLKTGRAWR